MKVNNEMPSVGSCAAVKCAYNVNQSCHARAVTIGHVNTPGCDTFLEGDRHCKETHRIAGVGACKVDQCKLNDDYECLAETIQVGFHEKSIKCLTFIHK